MIADSLTAKLNNWVDFGFLGNLAIVNNSINHLLIAMLHCSFSIHHHIENDSEWINSKGG